MKTKIWLLQHTDSGNLSLRAVHKLRTAKAKFLPSSSQNVPCVCVWCLRKHQLPRKQKNGDETRIPAGPHGAEPKPNEIYSIREKKR